MKLHYCRYSELQYPANSNVGDDLNAVIWPWFLKDIIDSERDHLFVGIGTILDSIPAGKKAVIFGSGFRHGQQLPDISPWKIYCLRGPSTAKALGLSLDTAITDPAILTPDVIPLPDRPGAEVGFIPHVSTAVFYGEVLLRKACSLANCIFIDPRLSPAKFIEELARCKFTLCEAMHGAILSDTYGIPWQMVLMSKKIDLWKWQDWAETIRVSFQAEKIYSGVGIFKTLMGERVGNQIFTQSLAAQLRRLKAKATPQCSKSSIREKLRRALLDRLGQFKEDYANGLFD